MLFLTFVKKAFSCICEVEIPLKADLEYVFACVVIVGSPYSMNTEVLIFFEREDFQAGSIEQVASVELIPHGVLVDFLPSYFCKGSSPFPFV